MRSCIDVDGHWLLTIEFVDGHGNIHVAGCRARSESILQCCENATAARFDAADCDDGVGWIEKKKSERLVLRCVTGDVLGSIQSYAALHRIERDKERKGRLQKNIHRHERNDRI